MSVKLSDIAKLTGVSKSTVSRALQGSPVVKEATRQLIVDKAREMRYKPNSLAQAMATKKSGIIAYLMYRKDPPYVSHTFFGPVLDGAIAEAALRGYHIILAAANDIEHTFDEHFIQDSIDGAIIVSYYPDEVIKEFEKRGIPLVVINDVVESKNNTFIIDDNYKGACAVLEHLIRDRGHRKIIHITESLEHPSFIARYQAYLDVHQKYGIPLFSEPYTARHTTFQEGIAVMETILTRKELPTAVFAVTDSLALGAIHTIKKAGLRVPEDIAVAGYDDIEAASMSDPALTTICVDRQQIGRTAVSSLIQQISDTVKASRVITIKNKLVIRETT
ncbi:LacI family DNA-binding transcriptional regulator [Treponema sp.]